MTTLARATIENTLIPNLLTFFRTYLSDPLSRNNTGWIRSESQVRAGFNNNSTSTGVNGVTVKDLSRKRGIIKESQKVGYPEVIISDLNISNVVDNFIDGKINYIVNGTLNIRILDTGNINRIANISGQISSVLMTYKYTSLRELGLSKLEWDEISLPGYSDEDNEFREKQIELRFRARLSEWQAPK